MENNSVETIKLPNNDWRQLILSTTKGRGKNRYYTAICPICLLNYDVDVLSGDACARALAIEKVASHIKSRHSEALPD